LKSSLIQRKRPILSLNQNPTKTNLPFPDDIRRKLRREERVAALPLAKDAIAAL
jgi:hypothetical protein